MKNSISIQIKAILLLVVFSINTAIGFACSIGVNLGFNRSHAHSQSTGSTVHVHGKQAGHKHESSDTKDNCCKDNVAKIIKTDKAVPQPSKLIHPTVLKAFIYSFFTVETLTGWQDHTNNKHFVRGNHPPIPDIRVAIQSFQI